MQQPVIAQKDVPMKTRDGVTLRADIFRPDDKEKHPAILIRTPYGKQTPMMMQFPNDAGFGLIIQDVRGRFASEGEFKRDTAQNTEGMDGHDMIEWIASQPWCDGNVGMWGVSALAGAQWSAAIEKPPRLKAVAPWMGALKSMGMSPRFTGGAISLAASIYRIPLLGVDFVDRMEKQGQDVTEMRKVLQWVIDSPDEVINFLPLKNLPFLKYKQLSDIWNMGLKAPSEELLEKTRRYEDITVPCFQLGGWYDILGHGALECYTEMRKRGGSAAARDNQFVMMGPWTHGMPVNYLGNLNFGYYAGREAEIMMTKTLISYFDKYIRGRDIDLSPVTYFVMGKNSWKTAQDWPLPQTKWERFFFHSRGRANTGGGDGWLSPEQPAAENPDIYVYNPLNPVPSLGGCISGAGIVPGPLEQYYAEKRSDVLCYTSRLLDEDVEVTGPINVHVFATTSAVDTDFTAKLCDVYPDGRSYNLVEGIIRSGGRKFTAKPELISPGNVCDYTIIMGNTSNLFRKGHRIRIDISSSNFPLYDRNMNTGNPIGEDAVGIPAMQTVYHQSDYASYIDLPIIR
jgi:uncharacterized protein